MFLVRGQRSYEAQETSNRQKKRRKVRETSRDNAKTWPIEKFNE
jgi:hypothetical protein